jgi:hypothetical protein
VKKKKNKEFHGRREALKCQTEICKNTIFESWLHYRVRINGFVTRIF